MHRQVPAPLTLTPVPQPCKAYGRVEALAAVTWPVVWYDVRIFSNAGCMSWKRGSTHQIVTFVYVLPDGMMAEAKAMGKPAFCGIPR